MDHKHLTLNEMLEQASMPSKGGLAFPEGCDICLQRREKGKRILSEFQKREFDAVSGLSEKLVQNNVPVTGFMDFISRSNLAEEGPGKSAGREKRKPGMGKRIAVISGLVAASLLVFMNYFSYLFVPEEGFIRAEEQVRVARKGLWWGSFSLESRMVLPVKDTVKITGADTIIDTRKGVKIYGKKAGALSFSAKQNEISVSLLQGSFFMVFDKSSGVKRWVDLPLENRIIITGTKIYFDIGKENYRLYLYEGSALLQLSSRKPVALKSGHLYSYSGTSGLKSNPVDKEEEKKIFTPFKSFRGIEKDYSFRPVIPEPVITKERVTAKRVTRRTTLKDLRTKYGQLSLLVTKDNKRYIGALKIQGKTVRVITVNGTVTVPSVKIHKISPYE